MAYLGTGPSRVPAVVVVPRGHARRRLHEHDLRVHPASRSCSPRSRPGRRDRRLLPRRTRSPTRGSRKALIMMIAVWNWVELADPDPDRRHRHRPATPDRPAGDVPQRGLRPRAVPAPRRGHPAVPRRDARLRPDVPVGPRPVVRVRDQPRRSRSSSASGMRFIVNLLAFWVLDWRGLLALSSAFTTVASGFVDPARVLPGPWTRDCSWCCRGRR